MLKGPPGKPAIANCLIYISFENFTLQNAIITQMISSGSYAAMILGNCWSAMYSATLTNVIATQLKLKAYDDALAGVIVAWVSLPSILTIA